MRTAEFNDEGNNPITDERTANLDDEALANLASELGMNSGEDLESIIERLTRLVEFIENDALNALLNFPLYGLLVRDLSEFQCLKPHAPRLQEYLDEYASSLDALEERLAAHPLNAGDSEPPASNLPNLINAMRTQESFMKKH
jgi:hypothetical protein